MKYMTEKKQKLLNELIQGVPLKELSARYSHISKTGLVNRIHQLAKDLKLPYSFKRQHFFIYKEKVLVAARMYENHMKMLEEYSDATRELFKDYDYDSKYTYKVK